MPGMTVYSNCGELKLNHRVCGECGYYDGKQVITPVVKDEKTKKKEKVINETTVELFIYLKIC